MRDDLLSCPFCGGEARLQEFDDGSGGVLCSECGFMPLTHASYGRNKSKQKAIAEWNQRQGPKKGAATRYEILKGTAEEMAYALIDNSYCDSCAYEDHGLCTFDADTEGLSYYEACYNAAITWLQGEAK